MTNRSLSILKQQAAGCLAVGRLEEGLELTDQCLVLDPMNSSLYLNKAVFQHKLGQITQSLSTINHSLALDPLNYHAYFNLFSLQMQNNQLNAAFKNLCCCLSVAHLLLARIDNDQKHIQKAIEYSFNNKEARALRCLQKLKQNKNIEALNQINYALYLDPSHPQLLAIQKQVYQSLGMKELKTLAKTQKRPRFEKLETCKEIPAADKIQTQILELLKEFNKLIKQIREKETFVVSGSAQLDGKQGITNESLPKASSRSLQVTSVKLINLKKLTPKMMENSQEEYGEMCFSATAKQRESTVEGSEKHESSIPEVRHFNQDQSQLQSEPLLEMSFDKLSNSSILNLSPHSKIHLGHSEDMRNHQNTFSNSQIELESKEYDLRTTRWQDLGAASEKFQN